MEKTIDDVLFNLHDWRQFAPVLVLTGVTVASFLYAGWGYLSLLGIISATRLDQVGALNTDMVDNGEVWRLLTSIFLHAGWVHLIVNGLNMYVLGALVQRIYGTFWMWLSFLLCGMSGSILTWAFATERTVGASGAIFGWMGILCVLGWKHRHKLNGEGGRLLRRTMVFWTVLSLGVGWAVPFIDNAAHMGGLLVGIALGMILEPRKI